MSAGLPAVRTDREDVGKRGDRPEISVLIHVTSAETPVSLLVKAYSKAIAGLGRSSELIFILDGVAGAVLVELEELHSLRDDIKILAMQGSGMGESNAYRAALEHSLGRYLITAGDYLQVDPREVSGHLEALDEGDDLVCSWRYPRVDPILNRLQSRFFNWFLRRVSKVTLNDLNCGFRAMRREVLEEIAVYGDLYRFLPIMATRRGFKVKERKVRHLEERGKTGFFGIGVYFRRLLDILAVTFLTRFTRKPLRFFGIIGILLGVVGMGFAMDPLIDKFLGGPGVAQRPILLLGVVLITFGIQFIGFGLVGEIIIFTQSRNLKDYRVSRVFGGRPTSTVVGTLVEVAAKSEPPLPRPAPRVDGTVEVRRPAPGEDTLLDHYVMKHAAGTLFHLYSWRRMVEEVLGRPPEIWIAERAGEVVGMLPYFSVRSVFLGKVAISMPFAVYGGLLADDAETGRAILRVASEQSDEMGNRYLELRQQHCLATELQSSDLYVTFVREIPEDPEECLGVIPRKARAEARRGRDRSRLRFKEEMDLKLLQRLFAVNKQALGSPSIPLSMLRCIQDQLREQVVMHQVTLEDGTPIAAVLSFLFRDRIQPYYSGCLSSVDQLGTNNFMYWKLMEWAAIRGIRVFDFGRSRRDSGAARFKKNMGFEAVPLHYLYHLGEGGSLPDFHPGNPRLGVYKKLWRKVPAPVARMLSAMFFKQLP
ncbi:MAG: FemAB family XrtA/PEP-CTERM system-associated protein [Planctomycetota bacterium]